MGKLRTTTAKERRRARRDAEARAAATELLDALEREGFDVGSRFGDSAATRLALGGKPVPWWRRAWWALRRWFR